MVAGHSPFTNTLVIGIYVMDTYILLYAYGMGYHYAQAIEITVMESASDWYLLILRTYLTHFSTLLICYFLFLSNVTRDHWWWWHQWLQ